MAFKANKWQEFLTESKDKDKDIESCNQKDLFSPSMDYDQQLHMLNEGFYDIIKDPKAALAALKNKAYEKYMEKFIMITNNISDKAQSVKEVIQEYFPASVQTAALTAIGFAIASMGKPDMAIRIMSGEISIGDVSSLLAALAEGKSPGGAPLNESLDSLLGSGDLANVNQAIDLAVMMGDIPDPDRIRTYSDKRNKLLVVYDSEEDGDKFIEWLEQNGVYDEESPDVSVGKAFYGSSSTGFDYRIRIHIATGDEGFEIGPLTGASTLGIRGI